MKRFLTFVFIFIFSNTIVGAQPIDEPDWDSLSLWAADDVKKACEINILESYKVNDVKKDITRDEFCYLCASVIAKWYDCSFRDVENIAELKGITDKSDFVGFKDTTMWYTEFLARLGIVSGKGNDNFEPESTITREEAAKMLYNTLNVCTPVIQDRHSNGDFDCCYVHKFNDSAKFENWSRNEINHIYRLGIMLGVSDNNFEPKSNYTKEQAFCTFLRLYYAYSEPEKNTLPKEDVTFVYEDLLYYDLPVLDFNGADNIDEAYKPFIIDSKGNRYSKTEKGWLPDGMNFVEVIDAAFPGIHNSHIIDNEGYIMLKNVVDDGSFYEVDVKNNVASVVLHSDYYTSYIYNLITGDLITEGAFENSGLYNNTAVFISNNKYGLINCENGDIIIEPEYKRLYEFYNDLAIAQKDDGTYLIVDISGKEIKSFKFNFDVICAKGTNMICKPKDYNNGDKYFVYRAYSEKKTEYYSDISFTDYEIVALKTSPHNYFILNSDCSVKKDCKGYSTVKYIGNGIYVAYKDNGESGLVDVINNDGNVIITDVPSNCKADESGLILFSEGEENPIVKIYDFSGNSILSHTFSDYKSTGFKEYNTPECYFVNGAVYISNLTNVNTGEEEELLLMPNGIVFK